MSPFPSFYDPRRIGALFHPDMARIAAEADAAGLPPASQDARRVHLLLIDMQVDFCHEAGSLYVPGALGDVRRTVEFIYRNAAQISQITCSLDSHLPSQIFSPNWWADAAGNHPAPFTIVSAAEVQSGRWQPLILKRTHHEPQDVFRYYRAADLCYVSSLHDGMNLVAKEFVSARDDERGALVLSTFAGAARELAEALVVNPYNLDEAADALAAALRMPPEEQRDRMRAMRSYLSEFNVYRWAGRMLIDASRVRQRERLAGRFSSWRSRFSFDTRTGVT